MDRSKTKIYCLFAASIILMLFGAVSFFLCFTGEFDADIGHFKTDTVFAPVMYVCMAAGTACGIVGWVLFARKGADGCVTVGNTLAHTVVCALCAAGFFADAVSDILTGIADSAYSYVDGLINDVPAALHYVVVIFGMLSALCMIVCAMPRRIGAPVRALAGFVPPLFLALKVIASHFNTSVAVNGPAKLTFQLALISLMLALTAEEGLNVQRKQIFPRWIFTLCISAVIGGSVGIGMLLVYTSGSTFSGAGIADAAMLTVLAARCLTKLFFAKDAELENTVKQ